MRLWRMRRRRDHIDATLAQAGAEWELTYLRNDRAMLAWRYGDEGDARAEADTRRRDLERAGWVSHW
jgi:hypothetical protein